MREERLLKRIGLFKKQEPRKIKEDSKKVIESIIEHLQKILNTKQGSVPIAEDYGVPDFTNLVRSFPESMREMERAIRQTISKYEPRLQGIRIHFIESEEDILTLKFEIIAKLVTTSERVPVFFETIIDADGRVRIK